MNIFLFSLFIQLTVYCQTQDIRVGGYTSVSNLQDQGLIQASNFLKSKHQELINATITRAEKQVVSGMNYRIFYDDRNGGQYQGDVYAPLNGNIRQNNFVILKAPNGSATANLQQNPPNTQNQTNQTTSQNQTTQINQTNQNPSLPPQNNNKTANTNTSQPGSFPPSPTLPTLPPSESYSNSSFTQVTQLSSTNNNNIAYPNNTAVGGEVLQTKFSNIPITSPTLPLPTPTNNTIYVTNNATTLELQPRINNNNNEQNNQQSLNQPTPYQYNNSYPTDNLQTQPQTQQQQSISYTVSYPYQQNNNNNNNNNNQAATSNNQLPYLFPQNAGLPSQLQTQLQAETSTLPIQNTATVNNPSQAPTLTNRTQPSINLNFGTSLYPLLTQPTSYKFQYAQSSQQGTLNFVDLIQPQTSISPEYYYPYTQLSRGCEMMNNKNTRCIICKGGYYLGTKGVCGLVDPLCSRYNPEDYSCLICANGFSFNGNYCSN